MSKRHDAIGIKQALRFEWLQKTVGLLLAGLPEKVIREELRAYLKDKKDNGSIGERGEVTTNIAVCMLMRIWVNPDKDLISLRNELLDLMKCDQNCSLVAHWAMISAAYPFWFNVAKQVGRLLNLQDQTTKKQIIQRIREQYGDRSAVIRSAQRVIQSFVSWGVLKESENKRCYECSEPMVISDYKYVLFLVESGLLALPEAKSSLKLLMNSPSFFPFSHASITGDFIAQKAKRINVDGYGPGDELLRIKDMEDYKIDKADNY